MKQEDLSMQIRTVNGRIQKQTAVASHTVRPGAMKQDTIRQDGMKQFDGKSDGNQPHNADAGRAVLVGLLGGIVSAAGYLVYQRLPEDQKQRIQVQVRGLIETRLNEIRQNFNI